jgi:hypothetical protein
MKNKVKRIEYTCSGYKYSPESFKCYRVIINQKGVGNHSYELLNFTNEENRKVANICLTEDKEKARAEIKRIVRQKRNKPQHITFAFRHFENNNEYSFIRELYANNNNLKDKLATYKEIKQVFEDKNWQSIKYTTGEMVAKNGELKMTQGIDVVANINRNKPIKIYFK